MACAGVSCRHPRAAEAAGPAHRLRQFVHFDQCDARSLNQHGLGDAVAVHHARVAGGAAVAGESYLHLAAVVGVDDPDAVGQARVVPEAVAAAAVDQQRPAIGNLEGQAGAECLRRGCEDDARHALGDDGVQVETGRPLRLVLRDDGVRVEFLDLELHASISSSLAATDIENPDATSEALKASSMWSRSPVPARVTTECSLWPCG